MTNTATTAPTTTARLYDYETDDDLGPATEAQIDASSASELKGENGAILISADGDVIDAGSWDARQPGARTVYTDI